MTRATVLTISMSLLLTVCAGVGGPFGEGIAAAAPDGGEWNQFRGPDRSGVSTETGLLRSWPEEGPKVLWRRPIGDGFSGVAIAGARFCTLFAEAEEEFLACFRTADGSEIWRTPIGDVFRDEFGRGPRTTPTIDGETIYALGGKGRLLAARLETGEPVWQVELHSEEFGFFGPQITPGGTPPGTLQHPLFGYSSSPLVEGDLVIFEAGSGKGRTYVALGKATGKTRWTALDEPGITYSSPMAVDLDGQRQIVVLTMSAMAGILPNGEVAWSFPWSLTVAQPVFIPPNNVFVSTTDHAGYNTNPGAVVVKVDTMDGETQVKKVWESPRMRNVASASVYYQGHIYGFDNATLRCLDAETGETRWAQRGLGKGSLIIADGLLFLWGDQGRLTLAKASPEGFEQLGQVQVLEAGRTWTPPALADGRLYLRGGSELVCVDVEGEG